MALAVPGEPNNPRGKSLLNASSDPRQLLHTSRIGYAGGGMEYSFDTS